MTHAGYFKVWATVLAAILAAILLSQQPSQPAPVRRGSLARDRWSWIQATGERTQER